MALDLGLTTHQLLSAMDGVAALVRSHGDRLTSALERGRSVPPDEAAFRTAAVGRRSYISARTGPEGLLDSIALPEVPAHWTALSVDGSHIDVNRHLPLRCHLINLGGCAITYGRDPDCKLFSEPAPGRGRRRPVPAPSRRGLRRDAERRPAAQRVAHGAGGGAVGGRRRKPAC